MTERDLSIRFQKLEGVVAGAAKDLAAIKDDWYEAADKFDRRLQFLEVAVRALEDREMVRKALEAERDRVSAEVAHTTVTRKQLWLAALAVMVSAVAPQVAAIVSHVK